MPITKADRVTVPCDCCGGPSRRRYSAQEWGICDDCINAGCCSKGDGEGGMLRGARCPLIMAGPASRERGR